MDKLFLQDVLEGLSSQPKTLKSKYFYDDKGSQIFQQIMQLDSYYLTNCEFEIFQDQAAGIINKLNFNEPFNLIELGAGDGVKTSELIRYMLSKNIEFTYTPIDISSKANQILEDKLRADFPTLDIQPRTGDYFKILKELNNTNKPALLLFIGSNLGNYMPEGAQNLVALLSKYLKINDKLLIGVDLKKNPLIVSKAYFDPEGVTKAFNINLLNRINNELGGNFNLDKFDFYSFYNPQNGEVRSYIISLEKQKVNIGSTHEFKFEKGEDIWTELSKKYDLSELDKLIEREKFELVHHFLDSRSYFTDSLYIKK